MAASAGSFGALMRSEAVRRRIVIGLNDVAGRVAERAAPIVLDGVRGFSAADAVRVLRGGPEVATGPLRERIGGQVIEVMLPEVAGLLRSDILSAMSAALAEKTGIDYLELGRHGRRSGLGQHFSRDRPRGGGDPRRSGRDARSDAGRRTQARAGMTPAP